MLNCDFEGHRNGVESLKSQQTYVQNRTRFAKVASYETSQETSVSCTQLVVLYAPFQFGSEYNFLAFASEILTETVNERFHKITKVK